MVPLLVSAMLLVQNNSPQNVLSGVYSEAQAARGKMTYDSSCSVCHNADLTGFSGPPLRGDLFMDRWREFNLDVLYNLIRTTMPNGAPGSLAESNYLDVLSYILKSNDLPAGRKDLTTDMVARTMLVGKNGPQPLPSSALVDVVGCLTLDSGNGWFLVHANEPARTLNQWEITSDDIKRDRAKEFGDQLFRLVNITDIPGFDPDAANGNKTEAKGTLVRQPNGSRINVTALQSLGAICEP